MVLSAVSASVWQQLHFSNISRDASKVSSPKRCGICVGVWAHLSGWGQLRAPRRVCVTIPQCTVSAGGRLLWWHSSVQPQRAFSKGCVLGGSDLRAPHFRTDAHPSRAHSFPAASPEHCHRHTRAPHQQCPSSPRGSRQAGASCVTVAT